MSGLLRRALRALLVLATAAVLAAPAGAAGPTRTLRPGQTHTYVMSTFAHGGSVACTYGAVRAVATFPPLPAPGTIRFATAFGIVHGKRVRVSIELRARAHRVLVATCSR